MNRPVPEFRLQAIRVWRDFPRPRKRGTLTGSSPLSRSDRNKGLHEPPSPAAAIFRPFSGLGQITLAPVRKSDSLFRCSSSVASEKTRSWKRPPFLSAGLCC
jgi:hypothetical protein